jgi:hypothetical protein
MTCWSLATVSGIVYLMGLPVCYVRFEVFTSVTMKNGVFWDVTPCGSCKNRRFLQEPHGVSSQKTPFYLCVGHLQCQTGPEPSISMKHPCTAHALFPECLCNHCHGLCHNFSKIFRTFDANSLFLFLIHCRIMSGQIHNPKYNVKSQHFHPAAWNCAHCPPRCASTVIYCCIMPVQLLYTGHRRTLQRNFFAACVGC